MFKSLLSTCSLEWILNPLISSNIWLQLNPAKVPGTSPTSKAGILQGHSWNTTPTQINQLRELNIEIGEELDMKIGDVGDTGATLSILSPGTLSLCALPGVLNSSRWLEWPMNL